MQILSRRLGVANAVLVVVVALLAGCNSATSPSDPWPECVIVRHWLNAHAKGSEVISWDRRESWNDTYESPIRGVPTVIERMVSIDVRYRNQKGQKMRSRFVIHDGEVRGEPRTY